MMFEIFRHSLKTGVVTTNYPDAPDPAPPAYRGQVLIDTARCAGHGDCMRVCPSAAIMVVSDPNGDWIWELDDARCVFCGLCAEVCPEQALELSNEFELAVRSDNDLTMRIGFTARSEGGRT